jgi:cytochrome c
MKRAAMTALVIVGVSLWPGLASAEPLTPEVLKAKGQQVAEQYCGACHATGKTGASANPNAPVFRRIFGKQPAGAIAEDLREGLKIGHKTMPRIQLTGDDVDALMTYMASIQETEI